MKFGSKLLKLWARYEKHIGVGAMVIGFTFDLIIAKRPDSIADNLLLLAYLCICAAALALLNTNMRRKPEDPEPLLLLLVLQFCFGGLANNFLILYGKSGLPSGDVLFLAVLLGMGIGNEYLRTRYAQLRFNIAVYYFLLLTYCVIAVPTFILHRVGPSAFLISGAISLAVAAAFLALLYTASRAFAGRGGEGRLLEAGAIVSGIFLLYAGAYFLNAIPPVPLSLKSIGIYHSVAKASPDSYAVTYEAASPFVFWRDTSATYHVPAGNSAYCLSAVFAPTGLDAPIRHEWEHYDEKTKQWVATATIQFPISGGRAEGYRGFSQKLSLTPGQWRCDVETARGQVIGRISFDVVSASTTPPLSSATI